MHRIYSTFAEKSYKFFFVGLNLPLLDRYLVFVPALDKVMESAHVIFDEVTQVTRSTADELLIVDPDKKSLSDFNYLVHLAYEDEGMTYVTTRVTTHRGFIVAYRAAVIGGRLGQEEPQPIHARDVERDLITYHTTHLPLMWHNNELTRVCNVVQGRPASHEKRIDHPHGSMEPALEARVHAVGAPPNGGYVSPTAAVVGKKTLKAPPADVSSLVSAASKRIPPASGQDQSRSMRERSERRPLNVGKLGDITEERSMYMVIEELADDTDDRLPIWDEAKVEELRSQVIEHDTYDVKPLPPGRKPIK